jgi:hypothetical protein
VTVAIKSPFTHSEVLLMMIQIPFMDWLGSNLAYTMFAFSMLFVIILAIYIKLFTRYLYEGTLYRHYRLGRLVRESDQGGRVLLMPLIDRLEIFEKESSTTEDI